MSGKSHAPDLSYKFFRILLGRNKNNYEKRN